MQERHVLSVLVENEPGEQGGGDGPRGPQQRQRGEQERRTQRRLQHRQGRAAQDLESEDGTALAAQGEAERQRDAG